MQKMNAWEFLNTSEGTIILYIFFAIFLTLLIVFYKLVKARELIIELAKVIDKKNKEINLLKTSKKDDSMVVDAPSKYSNNPDLKEQLIDKLKISKTSSEIDILFYVANLLKSNSEEAVKAVTIKDEWINGLSNGDTYKTLEKISAYLKLQNDDHRLYEIVGYQNRINSMSNLLHKGVIKLEEYNIEHSKINSAILEFIRKM
ncbi:MAG: hypothetical protein IT261_01435 [Saprospiraceae bacterium]|nr:hypothetical protein [Saprospiraceae bacterium]